MMEILVEKMKEGIKENPDTRRFLDIGINEYGLSEEEALDIMIYAWLNGKGV